MSQKKDVEIKSKPNDETTIDSVEQVESHVI